MVLLFAFGILLILGGTAAFLMAASAIHEILGTLGIGFGVLLCGIGMLARRLDHALAELRDMNRALFTVSHPEIPWPALPPERIVHEEWRGQEHWRMRADGLWEHEEKRGRWVKHEPQASSAWRV